MAREIALSQSDDGAIAKLPNDRMRRFVRAYVSHGKRQAGKAYLEAGYNASSAGSAATNACNLLHRADIQLAIQETCRKDLVALAPVANAVALELLENKQMDASVRARLLMGIWDRTGLAAATEHKVTVEHVGNDPQAIGAIRTMIEQLGLSASQAENVFGRTATKKAMQKQPVVIEGEFEDVSEPGSEGAAAAPPETEAIGEDIQAEEEPEGMEDVRW